MKSRDEMIKALKDRIAQLDDCLRVLQALPNSVYFRTEAVREELQTFLAWAERED